VAVSAAVVKELREKSGAGMMDCKKALQECGGDMEAASEWLRKKGLASADKKSGRLAAEGGVLGYIHPGARLGVLLEVNCETDFVARSEPFLALVNGLAMQVRGEGGQGRWGEGGGVCLLQMMAGAGGEWRRLQLEARGGGVWA
jgi:elongation factor Ts